MNCCSFHFIYICYTLTFRCVYICFRWISFSLNRKLSSLKVIHSCINYVGTIFKMINMMMMMNLSFIQHTDNCFVSIVLYDHQV